MKLRDIARWFELRWRLSRAKTAKERTSIRRSVGQRYRTKKPRDMAAEAKEASNRG